MKFVDELLNKFRKTDEAALSRLQKTPKSSHHDHEHDDDDDGKFGEMHDNTSLGGNTPLGGMVKNRTTPSKSITRLKAFTHKKTVEEIKAEDDAKRRAAEQYTERAIDDMGNSKLP